MGIINRVITKSFSQVIITLIGAFVLIYGQEILIKILPGTKFFNKLNATTWRLELNETDCGVFYISTGTPRAVCQLKIDNIIVAENTSALKEVRQNMSLSASFKKNCDKTSNIILQCFEQSGLISRLTHDPFISSYYIGQFIQLLRIISEKLLGIVFSIAIFFIILISFPFKKGLTQNRITSLTNYYSLLIYSIISIFYSLSLAQLPRLFFDGRISTNIHIITRVLYSYAIIQLLESLTKFKKIESKIQLFALVFFSFLIFNSHEHIQVYYKYYFLIFPVFMITSTIKLFLIEKKTEPVILFRNFGIAWCIAQTYDSFILWDNSTGSFLSTAMIVFINAIVGFVSFKEKTRTIQIENSLNKLLSITKSKAPIKDILSQVTVVMSSQTHFLKVSCYIDTYVIGSSDNPGKKFLRLTETGYQKDTKLDLVINFEEDRGLIIKEAIDTGTVIVRKGKIDNTWFIIVPIGKYATINFSEIRPNPEYKVYESEEILNRLKPALDILNSRLIEYCVKQGIALEKLKSIKGLGRFEEEIGVIFADINDSTLKGEKDPTFTAFLSEVYIPSLIKAIGNLAMCEGTKGDDIHLTIVKDMLPDNVTVREAVCKTITIIDNFIKNEGNTLYKKEFGFKDYLDDSGLTMSIGVDITNSTIICDELGVRSAGIRINETKRIQEGAPKNSIYIRSGVISETDIRFFISEPFPITVKKSLILVQQLTIKSIQKAA